MNKNTWHFQHLHDVAKQIVDDPHSADADLAAALQTATMELVTRYDDPTHALKTLYLGDTELSSDLREAVAIVSKADAAGDGGNDGGGDITNHPVVQAARLLVASGKFGDHGQALDYLLNKPAGQALLTRLKAADQPAAKESKMDSIHSIMKDGSIAGVCAAIVAKGSTTISEEEICSAVGKIAAERWPELSEAQAFARIYTASTDEARVLQKAISIAKSMPYVFADAPLQVGGAAAQDLDDPAEAVAQLQKLGQQKYPSSSASVQFERALTDPANAVLARRAVPRPQPSTSYPFPR
jgi:hypothetical protein